MKNKANFTLRNYFTINFVKIIMGIFGKSVEQKDNIRKIITVRHISSRTSANFHDNYFEVSDVPMTNHNSIVISEALNEKLSIFGDGGFSPIANGSSYTIATRGYVSQKNFADVEALQAHIVYKLNSCSSKLNGFNA
jgi:hypothetical protein